MTIIDQRTERNQYDDAAEAFYAREVDTLVAFDTLARWTRWYNTVAEAVAAEGRKTVDEIVRTLDLVWFISQQGDDGADITLDDLVQHAREGNDGYGADVRQVVRITLAGGGPAGWIDFTLYGGEVEEAEVAYCDWFQTPRTFPLTGVALDAAIDLYCPQYAVEALG